MRTLGRYFRPLLLLGWTFAAGAANAADIAAAPLPEPYRSAAMLGRGGAGLAFADYEDALFVNPAGLALFDAPPLAKSTFLRFPTFEENINRKPETAVVKRIVLASTMAETSKASVELYRDGFSGDADPVELAQAVIGKNVHVGAAHFSGVVFRRVAIGAFSSARADAIVFKNADYGGLETATARADAYVGLTAGGGHDVVPDRLFVGATFRYFERGAGHESLTLDSDAAAMREKIAAGDAFQRGRGRGGDLGLTYRTAKSGGKERAWAGFVLRDIGDTAVSGKGLNLRQTADLGLGGEAALGPYFLRLMLDCKDLGRAYGAVQDFARLRAGAELWLSGTLGLQGGLYEGYATAGAFLDLVLVRLEAGTYAEELGSRAGARRDERFFARLSVGL